MKKFILVLGLISLATVTYAKSVTSTLYLNTIQANKMVEKQGDELYFAVTEFPSEGRGTHVLIPAYPMHFQSKYLHKIKALKLWQKALQPGQSAEVIVALIEHDVPPWNTDDLIGTFKVLVANKNGQIITQWSKVEKESNVVEFKVDGAQRKYTLTGEESEYKLAVELN